VDRPNEDPLIIRLAEFLDANMLASQGLTSEYEKQFYEFARKVAINARPS